MEDFSYGPPVSVPLESCSRVNWQSGHDSVSADQLCCWLVIQQETLLLVFVKVTKRASRCNLANATAVTVVYHTGKID